MKASIFFLAGLVAASPAALEKRITCAKGVQVIVARGTFEFQGNGLQQSVVDAILKKIPGSAASSVVYPASPVNIADSLQSGVTDAQKQITQYAKDCPGSKLALLGYSQGGQVIGDSLSGGGTGKPDGGVSPPATPLPQSIGKNIVAVVLFGDPNRIRGQGQDTAPDACTVNSSAPRLNNQAAMSFYADRLNERCSKDDPVCCSSGGNIFAHLGYFGPQDANNIADYVAAKFAASK